MEQKPPSQSQVWLARLKHPDPAVRLEALRSLEIIGDPALLFPLADCFATDSDDEVRMLARRVGKAIYFNIHRQAQVRQGASEEERRRAAQILAKARAKKKNRR